MYTTFMNRLSFMKTLMIIFIGGSILPIIFTGIFSYENTSKILVENMQDLSMANTNKTGTTLEMVIESYEDILYQLYTNDDLVTLTKKVNEGEDMAVTKNQIRRILRSVLNSKEYIRSISILALSGEVISYDQLSPVSVQNSWLDQFNLTQEELYEDISADNKTHLYGTEYAATFASQEYYLFHLGHRIINYKKLQEEIGVVVISMDESLLQEICRNERESDSREGFLFLCDELGRLITYQQKDRIGQVISSMEKTETERESDYMNFAGSLGQMEEKYVSIYLFHDEKLGWDVVNVVSKKDIYDSLRMEQKIIWSMIGIIMIIVLPVMLLLTELLNRSVKEIGHGMERAGKGDLDSRVEVGKIVTKEINTIAIQFNLMLGRLKHSMEKEKQAVIRQRNAEITALEAEINPHFLYNTLDTINWLAIDREDYEVSNAICSLATILRYSIDNRDGIVTVREEMEWLKQYIYLQQTRLKNTFECRIQMEPSLAEEKIHKLLLQPFVENSILHGFEGVRRQHILEIDLAKCDDNIRITIKDNGKGMPPELADRMNERKVDSTDGKVHIGLQNAIMRLTMYYGDAAKVQVKSQPDLGTSVSIIIPQKQ